MKMKLTALSSSLIVLGGFSVSAFANVTLTGSLLNGSGVVLTPTGETGGAVTYFSTGNPGLGTLAGGGGYIQLKTPDTTNTGGSISTINIENGYDGVSLGTLNSLLTAGAAGNVSFDLSYASPDVSNNLVYWDVTLVDPNNSATTETINAYSDNTVGLGANPFNEGQSVDASTIFGSGPGSFNQGFTGTLWNSSSYAGNTDGGLLPALGTWAVESVSIGIGGWGSKTLQTQDIDSITLPGTLTLPPAVPDGGSTVSLLGMSLIVLGACWRKFSCC